MNMVIKTLTHYDKVEQFVQQQIRDMVGSRTVVVRATKSGYSIGNMDVINGDTAWLLKDRTGKTLQAFRQRRIALLTAALLFTNKTSLAGESRSLDTQYDMFLHDFMIYKQRLEQDPDNMIMQDRFDRVKYELETIKSRIMELEKTANLQ